ncbi:hypothetical protein SG34_030460 [Thalassomonas viridans]|uniref:Uncharacterized protein n=1 Tax=Thalassomonas viridans TaxID=137584 RepID=A0AAE9ZBI0_9GAMM|nr:hypothetical protein [Thalassomonas viridans]WDE09094.1 hypothetical protein SG34_030460 [Thalassomonas viridans]
MTEPTLTYRGTLKSMPFPHKPSVAEAQMLPLTSDSDFEVFTGFSSSSCPVLLNVREHYQLLSDLVDVAQECWPGITILVRISMPGGMRIPAKLLTDNILLLEDVAAEEQKLVAANKTFLVVEDRFSHVEIDNNDNSIYLRLYANEDGQTLTTNALQPLISCLQERGVVG